MYTSTASGIVVFLVQRNTHRRHQREVHSGGDEYGIRLLPKEDILHAEQLPVDARDDRTAALVGDVGLGVEEVALHHECLLLSGERGERRSRLGAEH